MRMSVLLSRGIIGLFYLYSGIKGLIQLDDKIVQAATKGVPAPGVVVPISLILLFIAGLTIMTGYATRVGVVALALVILPVTLFVHDFWSIAEPVRRIAEWNGLQSNLALLAYGDAARLGGVEARARPMCGRRARYWRLARRLLNAAFGSRFERAVQAHRRPGADRASVSARRRGAITSASATSMSTYVRRARRRAGD